jgi:D-alanyl-D-alanine dipeptidase
MKYFPKSRIITNQKTSVDKLSTPNGTPYTGQYYTNFKGESFTGADPKGRSVPLTNNNANTVNNNLVQNNESYKPLNLNTNAPLPTNEGKGKGTNCSKEDKIPDSHKNCTCGPPSTSILNEPIIEGKSINAYGGKIKGKKSFIDALEKAIEDLKKQNIDLTLYKDDKEYGIGDTLRPFTVQANKYKDQLTGKYKGANVAHPCQGYHVIGQAVDFAQTTKFRNDILNHGPIYKALYDAGLRRIPNEYWHWGLGETTHDINTYFRVPYKNSPADFEDFTRY